MFSFLRRFQTPSIELAELEAGLADGSIRLIDVREESEYRNGHVRGALLIPIRRLPDRAAKLKRDQRYALICASGHRSASATRLLLDEGFEGAVSVRGGTGAWVRSGRTLVR